MAEHESRAQFHDKEAAAHESRYQPSEETSGAPIRCYDQPLAGTPTTGGKDIHVMVPCWTSVTNPTAHHLEEAKKHREMAARHRAAAKALLHNEAVACAGLGAEAINQSPFAHREDILAVAPYREGESVMGARVTFRKVPGLTVEWMGHALTCHQTRAAVMGYSTTFQPYCPVSVRGAAVSVTQKQGAIVVTIRGKNADVGAVILGRAQDLLREDTSRDE